MNCSDRCSIGMEEGNLSPPVLAKNKGTEVFRLVSAAKARLARACPISCLYCIGANTFHEYSPSLRRSEYNGSVPQIQTCYTSELVSSMVTVPRFAGASLAGACPIPCLYCIGANAFDGYSSSIHIEGSVRPFSPFWCFSQGQGNGTSPVL